LEASRCIDYNVIFLIKKIALHIIHLEKGCQCFGRNESEGNDSTP